ncbi:MAG: hypothetical protein AB1393_08310 [Candidatus Edwardsbacteria bacterium]
MNNEDTLLKKRLEMSEKQIRACKEYFFELILPMVLKKFLAYEKNLMVAVTGTASFGAADEFSDCDASIFLSKKDHNKIGNLMQDEIGKLPMRPWAEVQDPGIHFTVLNFGQMGLGKLFAFRSDKAWSQTSPVALWHLSKYKVLYDPKGKLSRFQSIAKALMSLIYSKIS